MRDNFKVITILCIAVAGLLVFFTYPLLAKDTTFLRSDYSSNSESIALEAGFSMPATTDVFIPAEMSFAGEKVPLHRLDVKEALHRELLTNTYLHSRTIQLIRTAPNAFRIIEPLLRAEGIPDDFKYLVAAESAFNPIAVSPSGAVGMWQILAATGKQYGLTVSGEIDERYNVEKATHAAALYLKSAYEKYGSWTTAAASYNAGMGAISKFIDNQEETSYYDLLLSEETSRYIFRILALKQILNNPELYNFYTDPMPEEELKAITIKSSIENLAKFAKSHDISYKTLKRFNPWLRKNTLTVVAGNSYKVMIPKHPDLYR